MKGRVKGWILAAVAGLQGVVVTAAPAGGEALCGALEPLEVAGEVLCTHGDDEQFAEAAAGEPTRTDGAVPVSREQCYGDGINGPRVQVLYLHAAGQPDRSGTLRSSLLRWTRQVEWTVAASAQRQGGRRHVRWVTTIGEDGRCVIDLRRVTVTSSQLSDFSATITALRNLGWNERDRKYLLFADSDTYCGLASAPRDDTRGTTNASERAAGYARVDRRCWGTGDKGVGSTAAHELLHTIGAVQDSAPHATGRAHCTDEYDVMCYADGGAATSVRCRDTRSTTSGSGDHNNHLLDCNGDDYFHVAPRSGSYLATRWNTADSSFLTNSTSDGPGHRGANRPDVTRDPRGRPQVWPGLLGGAHRPLLVDAHGWEACDLPVDVHVVADEDQGVTGLVDPRPDPVLEDASRRAITALNGAVGRTVLRYVGLSEDDAPRSGAILVAWGRQSPVAKVTVSVSDARIRSGSLELSRSRFDAASAAVRGTYAFHGFAQSLGLGTIPDPTDDLMNAVPVANARTRTAVAALRHLYGGTCTVDARLDTVMIKDFSVAMDRTPSAALVDPVGMGAIWEVRIV